MGKQINIFSDAIEGAALNQFYEAMKQDCVIRGALLPDAHAGYTLPIGAVIATKDVIFPSYVGYDIGCGVVAVKTTFSKDLVKTHAKEIFDAIYKEIPVGFSHHASSQSWTTGTHKKQSQFLRRLLKTKGYTDLHTLGGGNHFMEVAFDEADAVWFVIHSGSRGLGHAVASEYMKIASGSDKAKEGHFPLKVESLDGHDYITDMSFCLDYALENRRGMIQAMGEIVRKELGGGSVIWDSLINRNHNHAEAKGDGVWIHRKGATHAEAGMMGVIPGSMRDGSFVVRGKGNPDSLCSSSHGAGRVMGRKDAKRKLNLEEFKAEMQAREIQALVTDATLDESAGAYKNIFEVMEMQKDLVEVVHHLKPLINIKG